MISDIFSAVCDSNVKNGVFAAVRWLAKIAFGVSGFFVFLLFGLVAKWQVCIMAYPVCVYSLGLTEQKTWAFFFCSQRAFLLFLFSHTFSIRRELSFFPPKF